MAKMQNPFVWHDLMTTDVEAAKIFYSEIVGWTFNLQPPAYNVALVGDAGSHRRVLNQRERVRE